MGKPWEVIQIILVNMAVFTFLYLATRSFENAMGLYFYTLLVFAAGNMWGQEKESRRRLPDDIKRWSEERAPKQVHPG